MVGILRAWKVRVEEGVDSAERDALVRVRHTGGSSSARGEEEEGGSMWTGALDASLSFVAAIWVSKEAKRRRSS